MRKPDDLSRSLTVLEANSTLIAVIEMSQSSRLVAGIVPGVERQPLKKIAVDASALLKLLNRWRGEEKKAGCKIERIAVAFEAGRDGLLVGALAPGTRYRGLRYFGALSQGNASVICRASHSAVGFRVTAVHSSRRRRWLRIRNA